MSTGKIIPIPKIYHVREGVLTCLPHIYCEKAEWKSLTEAFTGYGKKLY